MKSKLQEADLFHLIRPQIQNEYEESFPYSLLLSHYVF